ncbi:MAG TPA: tRNA dihydrouridine synthase DusB [Bacteroidales bacterium]|nr:tRNA dihydrouridine synthase DusB [Bacteroidales bacterium]HQI71301.1 tRNA dihydrouridine synthase DusB [Bacteroidales bacterium]
MNEFVRKLFSDFILALAPMEDVTDTAFRRICKSYGADMVVTEFVAAEGLLRCAEKSKKKLVFDESERPIGIQLFGNNKDSLVAAAAIAEEANPDFIDLNFGCPVKKIVDKGGGAALLKDIPKMLDITTAVVKSSSKPVFVKTRLGWDEKNLVMPELAEQLQDVGISAITIHGRTKTQMYKGKADWSLIGAVKNNPRITIPVIGNGDVDTPQFALEMKDRYGVDGVMIGRAAIGNPWIFKDIKEYIKFGKLPTPPLIGERIEMVTGHLLSSVNNKGERTAILEMRKHYSTIFRALENFKQFRTKLVSTNTLDETLDVLKEISEYYK